MNDAVECPGQTSNITVTDPKNKGLTSPRNLRTTHLSKNGVRIFSKEGNELTAEGEYL